MSKTIYDLELHENLATDNGLCNVIRVHGGWLYERWRLIHTTGDYEPFACVFVPFHNEFQIVPDEPWGKNPNK